MRVKTEVTIKPLSLIAVALGFLLIPWQWMLAWLAASVVHELCHYGAVRACRSRVLHLSLGLGGAEMKTEPLSPVCNALCSAAGPAGSILLLLFSSFMPRLAVCGLFHGLYNLLPIYPMDGGRIVYCLLPSQIAESGTNLIGNTTIFCLILLLAFCTLRLKLGIIPLLAIIILLRKIKIPCKQRQLRVQ